MKTTKKADNVVVIGLGSNINPEQNIASAKKEIGEICNILKESEFVYTKPLLYSEQADFLNGALLTMTNLDFNTLRKKLKKIEVRLGRVKGENKNGPRTIDLDMLIYNDIVTDNDIYKRDFLKDSIAELLPDFLSMPDVQNSIDTRNIRIDKVGVKNIRYPVRVKDRSGGEQHTVAHFNMYVELPHKFKGTHMSRFIEVLNAHEYKITVESFKRMLVEMIRHLDAEAGYIEMTFTYFTVKTAPVSGVRGLVDYEVTFVGEISGNQSPIIMTKVVVPVTSVCPCSKEISDCGAHNQRSQVTVTVRTGGFIWIEEIIDIVEKEASCELYSLLKRPDEKYVTEYGYENPKFVEDIVRDIAVRLNEDERVTAYTVESENFESIHNHSAFARIRCDKEMNPESG